MSFTIILARSLVEKGIRRAASIRDCFNFSSEAEGILFSHPRLWISARYSGACFFSRCARLVVRLLDLAYTTLSSTIFSQLLKETSAK
jgi:hypothetical protein